MGQTFRPVQPTLVGVELAFQDFGAGSAEVTVEIREDDFDGALVGSTSSVLVLDDPLLLYRFDFDPPLTVTPAATYMISISTASNGVGLGQPNCFLYDRGNRYSLGNENPDNADIAFLTYGACGNGAIDDGEDCDDGIFESGCCEFPSCAYTADATPCPGASLCENASCDGAGTCEPYEGAKLVCDDASKALLVVKNSSKPGKDFAKFKWIKGSLDAGVAGALESTGVGLCLYDGNGAVVEGALPEGFTFTKEKSPKFSYKDKEGSTDAVTGAAFNASDTAGKAKASFDLGGSGFEWPAETALTAPVIAQIVSPAGLCLGASFDGEEIKKNSEKGLVAKEKNVLP